MFYLSVGPHYQCCDWIETSSVVLVFPVKHNKAILFEAFFQFPAVRFFLLKGWVNFMKQANQALLNHLGHMVVVLVK